MNIKNFENKFKNFDEKIYFNYSVKKLNWFNIGGDTKIYFKPDNLKKLVEFFKLYKKEEKLFVLDDLLKPNYYFVVLKKKQ